MKHIFEYLFSKKSDLDKIRIPEYYILRPSTHAYYIFKDDIKSGKYVRSLPSLNYLFWVIPEHEYENLLPRIKKYYLYDFDIWKSKF